MSLFNLMPVIPRAPEYVPATRTPYLLERLRNAYFVLNQMRKSDVRGMELESALANQIQNLESELKVSLRKDANGNA